MLYLLRTQLLNRKGIGEGTDLLFFNPLSFSSFFRVLCLPNQFFSPSFLGLPLPAFHALLVSQRDRPSFSGLPFALSPVQSPRFPISCFLYGTAPPMPTQVPSPPPQLSLAGPCDALSPWSCPLPVPWQTLTWNQCCRSTSLPLCLSPWCSREVTSTHSLSPGLCQYPGSAEALVLASAVSHFL